MKLKILTASMTLLFMLVTAAIAQNNDLAPQILTSDLVRTQVVEDSTKEVSFVIVDSDNITDVTINGESQVIDPDTTVVIDKTFSFKTGNNLITVVAIDEKGNKREKSFLVGFQVSGDQKISAPQEEKSKFTWKVQLGVNYEIDDNPTLDFSSPIEVEGLDIQGVVPDDEQADNRQTLKATVMIGWGNIKGIVGVNQTSYSKAENDFLNSLAVYFGAGYRLVLNDTKSLLFNFLIMDINVGSGDYSQNQVISPALESSYKDEEGFYRHLFGIDYSTKDFADPDLANGSQMVLKWEYNSLDAERLDNFRSLFAYGSGDEGSEETKNSYYSMDFDWQNRWQSGFKWDLGFGLKQHSYENEPPLSSDTQFGSKRVDLPIRFSNAFGLQFTDDWYVRYTYDYTFNLSNKNIYVRSIQGLSAVGAF